MVEFHPGYGPSGKAAPSSTTTPGGVQFHPGYGPAPSKPSGGGGPFGGGFDIGHWITGKAELAAHDIASTPGAIYQLGKAVGHDTARLDARLGIGGSYAQRAGAGGYELPTIGKALAKQTYESFRHPLRDPFMTAMNVLPVLGAAGKVASLGRLGELTGAARMMETPRTILTGETGAGTLHPSGTVWVRALQEAHDAALRRAVATNPSGRVAGYANWRVGNALDESTRAMSRMRAIQQRELARLSIRIGKRTGLPTQVAQDSILLASRNMRPEEAVAAQKQWAAEQTDPVIREQNLAVAKRFQDVIDHKTLQLDEHGNVEINPELTNLAHIDRLAMRVAGARDAIMARYGMMTPEELRGSINKPNRFYAGAEMHPEEAVIRQAFDSHPQVQALKDTISHLSPADQTQALEGWHNLVRHYASRNVIGDTAAEHIAVMKEALNRLRFTGHAPEDMSAALLQIDPFHGFEPGKEAYNLRAKLSPRAATAESLHGNRQILSPEGHPITGPVTPAQWINRMESVVPSAVERDHLARWYEHFEPVFRQAFGANADAVMRGFAVSQANASPSGGLMAVMRVMDRLARGDSPETIHGDISVVSKSIANAVQGSPIESGVAAKLSDFIDALRGVNTRAWMGGAAEGGAPAPVDIWGIRDHGLVDQKLLPRLKARGLKGLKVDSPGSAVGARYERISEWYQQIADELNRRGYDGRSDWTPAQTQALGWSAIQRFHGVHPEDLTDALRSNTRTVNLEVTKGISGLGADLTPAEANAIGRQIEPSIRQLVAETGGPAFLQGNFRYGLSAYEGVTNGSLHFDVLSSPETAHAIVQRLANAFDQYDVWATRRSSSTGSKPTLLISHPDLADPAKAEALYRALYEQNPKRFAGFAQATGPDGTPAISLIMPGKAITQATVAEFERNLHPIVDAAAQKALGDGVDYHAYNTHVIGKEWTGGKDKISGASGARAKRANNDPLAAQVRTELEQAIARTRGARTLEQRTSQGTLRGAVTPTEDWARIYHGPESTLSTVFHEQAHAVALKLDEALGKGHMGTINRWLNSRTGRWDVAQHERFANAYDEFLRTGNAPPQIRPALEALRRYDEFHGETLIGGEGARPGRNFVSGRLYTNRAPRSAIPRMPGPVVGKVRGFLSRQPLRGTGMRQGLEITDTTRAIAEDARMAQRFEDANDVRRTAAAFGSELKKSNRDVLVLKAGEPLRTLSDEQRATLGMKTTRFRPGLEEEGVDTRNALARMIPGLADNFASNLRENLHAPAPEGYVWVDRGLLGELGQPSFATPNTWVGNLGDSINRAVTTATVYLKPGHFLTRGLTNAVTNIVQGSATPKQIGYSVRMYHELPPEEVDRLLAAAGQHGSMALPNEPGRGLLTRGTEQLAAGGQHWWAHYVDRPFRLNSILYEARKAGFDTPAKISDLLDRIERPNDFNMSAAEHAKVDWVFKRANRQQIAYDRLSPFEKRFLARYFWFYPWIKGAAVWSKDVALEHPYKAALAANLGEYGRRQQLAQLGLVPSYEFGLTRVGGSDANPLVTDLNTFTPSGTLAQLLNLPRHPLDLAGQLNPAYDALIHLLTQTNQYGQHVNHPLTTILPTLAAPTPEAQILAAWQAQHQDQSTRMFHKTVPGALARTLFGPWFPRGYNPEAGSSAYARELAGR